MFPQKSTRGISLPVPELDVHECYSEAQVQAKIVSASDRDIEAVRHLWTEYWDSLALPPDFQNFAEELLALPGRYCPPKGRLLIALVQGKPAGATALRPLSAQSCEAKRLYVRPRYRGLGIGKALLDKLIKEARFAGYEEMYGDTLESMKSALKMYRQIGFREVGPYSSNPTPGAVFLKLSL
jgi:GNAT superfamily N-acetyltransferase